jgi:hypothetical protein
MGFSSLVLLVQEAFKRDPHADQPFILTNATQVGVPA